MCQPFFIMHTVSFDFILDFKISSQIDVPGCSKEDIETLKQKYDLQLALREAYSGILYGYFLRKLCTRDTSLPTSFCEGERNSKVWLEEKNIHFPDTLNMT